MSCEVSRRRPPATGIVPIVGGNEGHREFVEEVRPDAVILRVREAKRLLANYGREVNSWFPDETTVITRRYAGSREELVFSWREEKNWVEAFEPDYHIPAFRVVEASNEAFSRVDGCERTALGAEWMREKLPEQISIIPSVKGANLDERTICEQVVGKLQPDMLAVSYTEYSAVSNGEQSITEHLEAVARETAEKPVLLLGSASPDLLSQLPDNVVASTQEPHNLLWRRQSEIRKSYRDLEAEVREALGYRHDGEETETGGEK